MNQRASLFQTSAGLLLAAVLGFTASRASAQISANDDAAPYANWQTGTNYGLGFQPWALEQTGTGGGNYTGFFVGNGGDPVASTNGNAWGMYANGSGGANAAEAFRTFSNSLPVNATFKIRWHNKGIGFSTGNVGGFSLRNGTATNLLTASTFYTDGVRFALYYIGGGSDNFVIDDGNGFNAIPLGFSSNPFQVEFTLLPGDQYNLAIKNAAGTAVLYSATAQPLTGSGTIDSAALFAFQTGGDQIFNNMEIFYSPPQIENLTPTNGAFYVNAGAGPLAFDVTSLASTVLSNAIHLTVNGVVQAGAAWTVFNSGTASNHVVLNTPLQNNTVYTGTITATDVNGNGITNHFTFNTWQTSPVNLYIAAEDYNFGSGLWFDNWSPSYPQPNSAYQNLIGSNGIDYLIYDLAGTNNLYRPNDLPALEACSDADYDNVASALGFQYDLSYVQNGEWEDYTRHMSNVTYTVYARMAGFGDSATMLLERTASPTVNSADQPRASLGTFVCPNTGGPQNWTFVPLTDFNSQPVQIRLPGTNTLRITDIGGSGNYNVNYLILVASTNTGTLHPYLASGFPYPNVGGVQPDQNISFVIANATTTNSVLPGTIRLFLNANDVTSGLVVSSSAAGATVSYQPTAPMPGGANTLQAVYSDGLVSTTNTWQFNVISLPVLTASYAQPVGSLSLRGFTLQVAKGDDGATNIDFPASVARAEAQLAGTLTNSLTGLPYANEALNNGVYAETSGVNYAIDPLFYGFTAAFPTTNDFPDIPAGGTNNVAMAAQMYVQLSAGIYQFGVFSDDGFKFTAGLATPANTNLVLGMADYGRAGTETAFSFIVQTNGLYPMRLLYFKAQFNGGGVQLYSINRTTGIRTLLNDPADPNAIPVFQAVTVLPLLAIQQVGTNVVLTWNDPSFSLQSAPLVTGSYTTVSGAISPYTNAITGTQEYFRLAR